MKTLLLTIAVLFSITIDAQITKTEAFTTGTKLAFYPNQCGNTIPEAAGKLAFCDRANNLGVVERSYGLSDRRVERMLPNHFNEDEYYITGNGLSIRNTDGTWENIPNIALPLWGNTYLPDIRTGLVLPNGKVIIQGINAGDVLNVYDRNLKTITAVNFPFNIYPQQMVYDQDRDLTWVFATSGNTAFLYKYNDVNQTITEVADLGIIGINTGSTTIGVDKTTLIYNNDFIYIGGRATFTYGLYKLNISNYNNSVPITYYDSTTTPGLPFDRIGALQFDANNDLWLANRDLYDGGIARFDITNETYTLYQTRRPDNAEINIRFDKLAIDDTGIIWAVGQNYSGLVKLTVENNSPTWTLLPKEDLTTLGVPITYNPNNIYFRNNKFYFTITDYSSGSNYNFEVIINENDVWSGRNDNEEGNLSLRMNKRFHENLPDNNGGVWWFNDTEDIVVYRDIDDNHQTIDIQNLGIAAVIDDDNNAIVKGGNPNELRKIDFPNAYSILDGVNQATDMKRVGNQVWIFDNSNKKIDVYKDDILINTYNLVEDWYLNSYYFAVDANGDAWFMRYLGSLEIMKFDTTTLTSTMYDLSAIGSVVLRKIVAAPNGGVWFLGNLAAVYQEAGMFYDFRAADYTDIYSLKDMVVDTNGKAYLLNNSSTSITTLENPKAANPIVTNISLQDANSIMPSLDHYGPSAIAIDSEGSIWTHASRNAFKLIDTDFATEYIAQSTLSIADFDLDMKLSIHPNPTDGIVHITSQYTIDTVEIYTILGQKVAEFNNTAKLDVSQLKSGIYILKIKGKTSNKFQNIKIVKM